jgi:predicted nucleotide-binding protein
LGTEASNQITTLTRRNVFDWMRVAKINWAGQLDEAEFLARIWDLESLPSRDHRHRTAAGDIRRHRVLNPEDWPDDWVFSDGRFNLMKCDDETLLRFLSEMLHPVVRGADDDVQSMVRTVNSHLERDGYVLKQTGSISGYPVFSGVRSAHEADTSPPFESAAEHRDIPISVVYLVGNAIGEWYQSHNKLNRLFIEAGAPGEPPPGSCVDKAQAWLKRINVESPDPLDVLSKLIAPVMSVDSPGDSRWQDITNRIQSALAKNGLEFDVISGLIKAVRQADAVPIAQSTRSTKSTSITLTPNSPAANLPQQVFLIHGHDHGFKNTVARFLEALGLEPIILHESPDEGKTIIEKFEDRSDVSFVIALCTADDVGDSSANAVKPTLLASQLPRRPRQNVVFEFGYFLGKYGRRRICAVCDNAISMPSDYNGVIYISRGEWQNALLKTLSDFGYIFEQKRITRALAIR